ncbi:hypothetical protein K7887_07620 [Sutcliffiella horikoshii]|uniref:hypothetical protein n=1 Tax=Sutcliffiella horikoshii TaxID=79883 RepID=UPI001CBB3A7A|nr:hypothetical protein [Sutcliffiella horikoshii]UAL48789.1 hypothetical protein K7887_07620 [Sutcliffiella horikoshii]
MNYEFVVIQKEIKELKNNKMVSSAKTFICVKDRDTGIIYPHPLTNFIKGESVDLSHAPTTQKSYAEEVKKFLNYILECIDDEDELFLPLEDEGLKGLGLIHGAKYLTYLKYRVDLNEIKPNTVFTAERLLTKFYVYLIDQNIINEKINIIYDPRKIKGKTIYIPRSPFRGFDLSVEFPARESREKIKERRLHDFGDGKLNLVNTFLRVAELEAPEIALGIAFQFYGGLRRGEVINLMRSSIKKPKENGSGEFNLDIKDNWKILFPNKISTLSEQVKKPRLQAVFKTDIVLEFLENHEERLKRLEKTKKIKNKFAYFVSNQGNPISGKEYWKRFTKVRDRFLEVVLEQSTDDYEILTSKPWSTHMGRGIYTNMLTFLLGWSPEEVAIARGDSFVDSAKSYTEAMNVRKKTVEATELIAKAPLVSDRKNNITVEDLRGIK